MSDFEAACTAGLRPERQSSMEKKMNPRTQRAREAIMDATRKLVSERSVADISLTEIAEAAGVSRPTIYNQFKDTPSLVAATSEQMMRRLFKEINEQLSHDDNEEYLHKMMELFVEGVYEQRLFARNAMWGPSATEITAAVVKLLSANMRAGYVGQRLAVRAPEQLDDCLDAISGGAIWMLSKWLTTDFKGENTPACMADRFTDTLLALSLLKTD